MEDSILFFIKIFISDNMTVVTIVFKVHSCLFRIILRKQLQRKSTDCDHEVASCDQQHAALLR